MEHETLSVGRIISRQREIANKLEEIVEEMDRLSLNQLGEIERLEAQQGELTAEYRELTQRLRGYRTEQ